MDKFKELLNKMELLNLLNLSDDKRDAILTIHSGAGGTDRRIGLICFLECTLDGLNLIIIRHQF